MSHALTLHFSHSPQGQTRVLVMIDLATVCPLCGYEEIHRSYHGTDYHRLSCERMERLVHHCPVLIEASCSNCSEPIQPDACVRGALHYAFPDHSGKISAYFDANPNPCNIRYTLHPKTRLDPQDLPVFDPVEHEERDLFTHLSENLVVERIGRVVSIPHAWNRALQHVHTHSTPVLQRVSTGLWIALEPKGTSVETTDSAREDLLWRRSYSANKLHTIDLTGDQPRPNVRLHPGPQDGSWTTWLARGAQRYLNSDRAPRAFVYALEKPALKSLETTLRQGRVAFERSDAATLHTIAAPNGEPLGMDVAILDVLRFAATSGMSLGDAGRYYGEMIIARLMGLTL